MSVLSMIFASILLSSTIAQQPPPASKGPPPSATESSPRTAEESPEPMVVHLKNTDANDIAFTLEDLLKPRNGPGPRIDEGPDPKTIIIQDYRPAQKDTILKMIEMFDVERPPASDNDKPAKSRGNPSRRTVQVLPLKHTAPASVMDSLIPLFNRVSMVAAPSTNSIIATGSADDLESITGLIAQIDQPPNAASKQLPGVRALQLKHRATDDVSKELMSLLGGVSRTFDGRVASDPARGKIILRGSDDFMEFASHVISELDVPAQMIQFEFAFFSADQKDTTAAEGIPADLEGVAKELARFGRVRLLGRLACNAMEDHEFHLEGSLGDGMSAQVQGSLINAVADGSIQLNVNGRVMLSRPGGNDAAGAKQPPRQSGFEIKTTIVTRRGDTVIIGTAPAGWTTGESAIMVLQVKQ